MDSTQDQIPELKECNQCFSGIDSRALVCSKCGSIQNRAKAAAGFFAGVAGLVTLMTSMLTYLHGQYSEWRQNRDPVEVLDYTYKIGGIFLNKSKDPLYLQNIYILLNDDKSTLYAENIQMILPGKSVTRFNMPDTMPLNPESSFSGRAEEWDKVRRGRASDCFKVVPILSRYYNKDLRVNAEARISYISTSEGTYHEKVVPMKAALLLVDKPSCLKYGSPRSLFP